MIIKLLFLHRPLYTFNSLKAMKARVNFSYVRMLRITSAI